LRPTNTRILLRISIASALPFGGFAAVGAARLRRQFQAITARVASLRIDGNANTRVARQVAS